MNYLISIPNIQATVKYVWLTTIFCSPGRGDITGKGRNSALQLNIPWRHTPSTYQHLSPSPYKSNRYKVTVSTGPAWAMAAAAAVECRFRDAEEEDVKQVLRKRRKQMLPRWQIGRWGLVDCIFEGLSPRSLVWYTMLNQITLYKYNITYKWAKGPK